MLMPMRLIGLGTADDVDIGSTWSTTTITVSTRQSMANKSREGGGMQRERDVYVRFCICNTINAQSASR
jgi:hypothetical protein